MKILRSVLVPIATLLSACSTSTIASMDDGPDVIEAREASTADQADAPNAMDMPNVPTDTGVCPMGTTACGMSGCVDLQTSTSNCGACGTACPMNQMCVAGVCRLGCPAPNSICGAGAQATCSNLQIDPVNCGACGNVCVAANGSSFCSNGMCGVAMCNAGFGNCDMNPANGCETNTNSTLTNCGGCGMACPAVANGTQFCVAGACTPTCEAGFVAVGGRCLAPGPAPRPIVPLSLGDVSLRRPTLRWELPAGTDGALVELCRDRACTMVIESIRAPGTSVRPTMALPPNTVVFWRLRATVGAATTMTFSPTWLFHVPATDNSGGIDTSFNPHLDVNGDGFDDVVVGASNADPAGRVDSGTASVYHGSAMGIPMVPTRVLEGVVGGDHFGRSVASAGDVNGDGFGDLVVGAIGADPPGRSGAGAVSIFLGSAMGVPTNPARVLDGVAIDTYFGWTVASAGDVNRDGYGDLVVSTPYALPGGRRNAGTAWVFHGSAMGIPMAPAQVLNGARVDEFFGWSVASAGDVNGDGFGDIVVGAYGGSPNGRIDAGTASVFHGSAMGIDMVPTSVRDGIAAGDRFGWAVASLNDVNGDGYGDLVVGAQEADPGARLNAGTASIFHGTAMGIPMAPSRVLEGVAAGDRMGSSVASARDVNGDGFGDLVVGAFQADPGGRANAGTVSVFHGSAMGIPMAPARVLEGVAADNLFGLSVASPGDVNGDDFADLVVGVLTASPGGRANVGTASVFHGSAMGVPMAAARVLEGVTSDDYFGNAVATASDVLTRAIESRSLAWLLRRGLNHHTYRL